MQSSLNQIIDRKIFLTIICLSFFTFLLTSDGHRYTFDEDVAQQQSLWIATLTPHPDFIPGESRMMFQFPDYFPNNSRAICQIDILCSQIPIGYALTQVPFILINETFDFITPNTLILTEGDFPDPHYVYWRNSLPPTFTFLELFYGPVFAALSVGVFYLISRTYLFSPKISTILSILLAFTTMLWSYSQTSLNMIPTTFFILFGFFLFRKFATSSQSRYLLMSGAVLGFAFLIRNDTILFIVPLFFYFIFISIKNINKIKSLKIIKDISLFALPLTTSYIILKLLQLLVYGRSVDKSFSLPFHEPSFNPLLHLFGLFFSPGVGLLIFCPILFTIFLSYFDFFKKNKFECIFFLSFITLFATFYINSAAWHGLNGWGPRYMMPIVAFLLLPLGFSIQKRLNKKFIFILFGLGTLGFIFNISNLITDVSWFIWGIMGSGRGLYELGHIASNLWVNPLVLWTFEYSQLTHALRYMFLNPFPDIYLLKVWGVYFYSIFTILTSSVLVFYLFYLNKKFLNLVNKLH
jgi:hypothetical protein